MDVGKVRRGRHIFRHFEIRRSRKALAAEEHSTRLGKLASAERKIEIYIYIRTIYAGSKERKRKKERHVLKSRLRLTQIEHQGRRKVTEETFRRGARNSEHSCVRPFASLCATRSRHRASSRTRARSLYVENEAGVKNEVTRTRTGMHDN